MRITLTVTSGLALLLGSTGAAAGGGELDVNDDAARVTVRFALESESRFELDAGWLHHQDRGDVPHFGVHLVGEASSGENPVVAGVGGRLALLDAESGRDGGALGVGAFFRAQLPYNDRIGFGGHLYYAPDVLAFGDAEEYREISAYASYNVLRDADVYLGARVVEGDFGPGPRVKFDNGLHLGVRVAF